MPKLDLNGISFENGVQTLIIFALIALVGFIGPKVYDVFKEGMTRRKKTRDMLLQLHIEAQRARPTAEAYSSDAFIHQMAQLIEEYATKEKPFRPFIPMVFREEKYKIWDELIIDPPKSVILPTKNYIEYSRLLHATLLKLQSEDFDKLTISRQNAAILGLVKINKQIVPICQELEDYFKHHPPLSKPKGTTNKIVKQ